MFNQYCYATSLKAPSQDFQRVNTQLNFTTGQTVGDMQCTDLQVLDDSILESTETLTLQLVSDNTEEVVITTGADSAVVTIEEDSTDGRNRASFWPKKKTIWCVCIVMFFIASQLYVQVLK